MLAVLLVFTGWYFINSESRYPNANHKSIEERVLNGVSNCISMRGFQLDQERKCGCGAKPWYPSEHPMLAFKIDNLRGVVEVGFDPLRVQNPPQLEHLKANKTLLQRL